jgi:hypothetical protein
MEAISKVNGESISSDRRLMKAGFTTGDLVVIKIKSRDYTGVVDYSLNEETVSKCVESPPAGSLPSVHPQAKTPPPAPVSLMKETPAESPATDVATQSAATTNAEKRTRKRVREDYPAADQGGSLGSAEPPLCRFARMHHRPRART